MIIWLASYPRSGNTFLRIILNQVFRQKTYSLYDDKLDIAADRKTSEIVGHEILPEDFSLDKAQADEKLYFIKTHEKPPDGAGKAIYLVRDGREATLSYRNYLDRFGQVKRDLLDIAHGNVRFGSWGEHVYMWAPEKRAHTLLIRFESLIENPWEQIDRLADFTVLEPSGGDIPGFEDLHTVNPVFFSSGKKDSWKEEYTTEQHETFWLMNCCSMFALGYTDSLPEVLQDDYMKNMFLRISLEHIDRTCQIKNRYDELLDRKGGRMESREKDIQESRNKITGIKNQLEESTRRRGELESRLRDANELLAALKGKLHMKDKALVKYHELDRRIDELYNTAFIRRPFHKYNSYRAVLQYHSALKKKP